ncbi:MAG TPA: Uma2 family endonuclease [Candidatus Limnocylindrales bacterium]|nr:Uma2 family endonuclease [Candidatus Limnocylindrales bacterium]
MAVQAQHQTYSADEFETLAAAPANANRLLELIDGEIVEKMTTEEHGLCAGNIYGHLWTYLRTHPIGRVVQEVHFRAADGSPTVYLPDVAVRVTTAPPIRSGSVPMMPDLAVEVKSPANTLKALRDKAAYYLAHGTQAVWIVIPAKRLVEIYGPEMVEILTADDVLEAPTLLPGFQMLVSAVFEGIGAD